MNRTVMVMLCCAVLFTRCSLRIAGVETTNGKIAIVRLANGSRASGAKATIVTCNDWYAKRAANATVVVDTAIADQFDQLEAGKFDGWFHIEGLLFGYLTRAISTTPR